MIYQSYNFVDSYSNASGNRKNSMVLGELGKVINKEPKAVISALQDAGVKVPRNPSKRDLVRLIIANKRNKNLVQNLSVLITASAQNVNFLNANGDGSFNVPTQAESMAQSQPPIPYALNSTSTETSTEKGGFLKSIGEFFQNRKANKSQDPIQAGSPQEQSGWQRFGKWFTKNRETIGQVGSTLYNSLGTANQNQIPTGNDSGNQNGGGTNQNWIQRNKVVVLVGILAIAGGIYFFNRGKKGKGKK
jgi:hypothetical protein